MNLHSYFRQLLFITCAYIFIDEIAENIFLHTLNNTLLKNSISDFFYYLIQPLALFAIYYLVTLLITPKSTKNILITDKNQNFCLAAGIIFSTTFITIAHNTMFIISTFLPNTLTTFHIKYNVIFYIKTLLALATVKLAIMKLPKYEVDIDKTIISNKITLFAILSAVTITQIPLNNWLKLTLLNPLYIFHTFHTYKILVLVPFQY